MGEISNKTLAVLVIIAILISLVGLFMGRARIVTVGQATTTTGDVSAEVAADIDIILSGGVDFGTVDDGSVWSSDSGDDCTAIGSDLDDTACQSLTPTQKITVTNNGNTPVDVGYYAASRLFTKLYSGGDNGQVADAAYQMKVDLTPSGCDAMLQTDAAWVEDDFMQIHVDNTDPRDDHWLVDYCQNGEYFDIYAGIKVPPTEPTGVQLTSTIWFIGYDGT